MSEEGKTYDGDTKGHCVEGNRGDEHDHEDDPGSMVSGSACGWMVG